MRIASLTTPAGHSQVVELPALPDSTLSDRLAAMPGTIHCAALHPTSRGVAVLATSSAFCVVDFFKVSEKVRSRSCQRTYPWAPQAQALAPSLRLRSTCLP